MAIDKSIDRTKTLGGSEMGTILGLNPYQSVVDLWLIKRGLKEAEDLSRNPKVMWGNYLESVVMDHYDALHGTKLERDERITGLKPDFLAANIDGYCPRDKLLIEVKTCTCGSYYSNWGTGIPEDPDDEHSLLVNTLEQIPANYMCQLQFYMWAKGVDAGKLILKADSYLYVEYPVKRNDKLIQTMLQAAEEFWYCVQHAKKVRPLQYSDALALWTPLSKETPVVADESCVWAYETLHEIKEQQDRLKNMDAHSRYTLMKHIEANGATCVTYQGRKIATAYAKKDGNRGMKVTLRKNP